MSSMLMLNGDVDDRNQTIESLRARINQLTVALEDERHKSSRVESGVRELRHVLDPLYRALQQIYDEMDSMGVQELGASVNPRVSAAWENWKHKLGGNPARFIDALLLHGPMTQTQLRIAVGCAAGSVAGVVCALNKAGLINKAGGKISLKEL